MFHRSTCLPSTIAIAAAFGLNACGSPSASDRNSVDTFELSEADMIESGREIVEAQCVTCHATGVESDSPRPDAPPLRTILADYPADALAEDFREHVHVGHEDMPDFDFGPLGTDHVLAYLQSIQVSNAAE